ncbi:MAG TPA: FkbM family methyltransferase [Microscillaceae bacterium]|nr:FkbM family methyltransferase [Microscillaceae bacterium]
MKGLKSVVWKLLNFIGIGGAINLHLESGLKEEGWFLSFRKKQSIDKNAQPIPWLTYAFINFLEPRLSQKFNLFEFGSGNSTLWYASRVAQVHSVEHDKAWLDLIKNKMPDNVQLLYQALSDENHYEKSVFHFQQNYHIIIVDGRKRNKCMEEALQCLTDDGVIILDNSNREQYQSGQALLAQNGFKKLDFWGMTPIAPNNSCTSVFYRTNNCLGI